MAYSYGNEFAPVNHDSSIETYTAGSGLRYDFARNWQARIAASYGREVSNTNFSTVDTARQAQCLSGLATSPCPGRPINPFGDAPNDPVTLAYIRNIQIGHAEYRIFNVDGILDGRLFQLPAGDVRLAVGASYRHEEVDGYRGNRVPLTGITTITPSTVLGGSRSVKAAFAEMVLPVFSERGREMLSLSAAARYEDYSDFGTTFNPKLGFAFSPFGESIKLRGSWGTAFRAPRLSELSPVLNQPQLSYFTNIGDPRSPTGRSNVLEVTGVGGALKEETADFWTLGLDIEPAQVPRLILTGTYFNFDYRGKILAPNGEVSLANQEVWAPFLIRNPTAAQLSAFCGAPAYSNSASECSRGAIDVILDDRLANLSGQRVSGVDFGLKYRTSFGNVGVRADINGTKLIEYATAPVLGSVYASELDQVGSPVDFRARASFGFDVSGVSATGIVNYTDSYVYPVLNQRVDAWTTFDASIGYKFEERSPFGDASIQLSVVNLFNAAPPFVDKANGYDGANASQLGRSVSLSLRKRW